MQRTALNRVYYYIYDLISEGRKNDGTNGIEFFFFFDLQIDPKLTN